MAIERRRGAQTRNASYQARLREHYRSHRTKKNGKWYNPLLDDAQHPDNTRHLTHGSLSGYLTAGCCCTPCSRAADKDRHRKVTAAIDKVIATHRAQVTVELCQWLPSISADQAAAGAEVVVSTHRVRNRKRAILEYQPVAVELALDSWVTRGNVTVSQDALGSLATALVEGLNP